MDANDGQRWWTVEFDADGGVTDPGSVPGAAARNGVTDLFVFVHGWNNTPDAARDLAADMFDRTRRLLDPARAATSGFLTVVWPSILFADDVPVAGAPTVTADTSGDHAALASAFPHDPATVAAVADLLADRPADQDALVRCVEGLQTLAGAVSMSREDAGCGPLLGALPVEVCQQAAELARPAAAPSISLGSLWDGAREVARTLSYYAMKARAGDIGARGLAPLLRTAAGAEEGLRIHLCGHSFGARLVSYALTGLDRATSPVASLVLVQGAFSHFAFWATPRGTSGPGALAGVADRVHGPLVATFTEHDRACGWWYPAASLLARQDTNDAGTDPTYRWGALGHDGYQGDDVVDTKITPAGTSYGFAPGRLTRVESSAVINRNLSWISGAHSDIRHDEVAWILVDAAR